MSTLIAPERRMSITLGSTSRNLTELAGVIASPSAIAVTYDTLPNNRPNEYGNFIALWQDTQIDWTKDPEARKTISGNSQSGGDAFDDLSLQSKPYIVGYGTGPERGTICSTLRFTPGNTQGTPFATTISVTELSPDVLIVYFETPVGNDPQANGDWIGLWEGKSGTYDGHNLLKKVDVTKNVATESQILSDVGLKFSTYYTVAYASGPAWANLAATFTFQTDPFLAGDDR